MTPLLYFPRISKQNLPICCQYVATMSHMLPILLYVANTTVCCQHYCMLPILLYVANTTVCCQHYCMLPILLCDVNTTVCCQYYCMLPIRPHVANTTVCCQYCCMSPILLYVANTTVCCQHMQAVASTSLDLASALSNTTTKNKQTMIFSASPIQPSSVFGTILIQQPNHCFSEPIQSNPIQSNPIQLLTFIASPTQSMLLVLFGCK